MNAIPTIPKPTTTIFFLFSGGLGYCGASSSGSCPLTGTLPACMPGDESAHDILSVGLWDRLRRGRGIPIFRALLSMLEERHQAIKLASAPSYFCSDDIEKPRLAA